MKKQNILFYTDCFIFAGCEKPMCELLLSDRFASKYKFKIIYRKSREYDKGIEQVYPGLMKESIGLRLPDQNTFIFYIEKNIRRIFFQKILKKIVTACFGLFSLLFFAWDFIIIYSIFSNEKSDIVHINNGGYPGAISCRAAALAAKIAGNKVVFSVHNIALKSRGISERIIDILLKNSVNVFITGSKASGIELSRIRGFDKSKIVNIYHGAKSILLPPEHLDCNQYKSDFLMVASMEERKGYLYVVLAIRKFIDRNPIFKEIKIKFIGSGPIKNNIEKLVLEKGLESNVDILGYRKDYFRYLSNTKILLNPSINHEDLPLIIIEAMSLGIPTIGSNVAGIPEEIENNVTGLIVAPGDIDELENAMLFLLSDSKKREEMGNNAKEKYSQLFTLDKMLDNYNGLYRSLMEQTI